MNVTTTVIPKMLSTEDLNLDRVNRAALSFYRRRSVPKELKEDCYQEAWIALLEKRDIFGHLHSWLTKEYEWRQPKLYLFQELYDQATEAAAAENRTADESDERVNVAYCINDWIAYKRKDWNAALSGAPHEPAPLQIIIVKLDRRECPWCKAKVTKRPQDGLYLHLLFPNRFKKHLINLKNIGDISQSTFKINVKRLDKLAADGDCCGGECICGLSF